MKYTVTWYIWVVVPIQTPCDHNIYFQFLAENLIM